MRIIGLGLCVLLSLHQVLSQTSSIVIGDDDYSPTIYNRTIEIMAATRPWYQRFAGFFTRSQPPVQNVTYTYPPKQNGSRCLITGVKVIDIDRYGKGGFAKIVDGGLHQNNVTINFRSKPGEPMLFRVTINGYCTRTIQPLPSNVNQTWEISPSDNHNTIGSYGWIQPNASQYNGTAFNTTAFNSTAYANHNATAPTESTWWQFW